MGHRVLLTLDFEADDIDQVREAVDDAVVAVAEVVSEEPMVGLEVDGTHREPDSPGEEL